MACLVISTRFACCLPVPASVWPLRLGDAGWAVAGAGRWSFCWDVLSLFSPRQPCLEPPDGAEFYRRAAARNRRNRCRPCSTNCTNRFIDLRQIWAFTYMRGRCLPVLLVVLAVGWALTGCA